ncbi:hypothetical protein OEZ86_009264 [Tetradesmus obliquus]|nr:hypothetical protein OEZ86_009264 [Tetradesmus obliquus]
MSLLRSYKGFVRAHPGLVLNAERLLHWVAWNPERFSGSEYAYEAFNAAVGLLGIYNESILTEHPEYNATVAKYALWLAAVEQVQTLVELRAIQMEQRGKMSRYGPLMALELVKTLLRLQLWRSSKCSLALEAVSREDQEQHECEQQLKDLLQALARLRQRYSSDEMAAPSPEQLAWQQQLLQEQRVRAAAIAPHRPPAACAAGELARFDLASGYGLHTGHAILCHSNASRWPPGSTLYSLALLRSLSSNRWSHGEQAELLGRQLQLLRYLLRSPCYDAVTRRLLQRMVTSSRWLPGLSSLAEFAFNMVEGMQSYYTYVEC